MQMETDDDSAHLTCYITSQLLFWDEQDQMCVVQLFPNSPHLVSRRVGALAVWRRFSSVFSYWPIFTALPRASYLYFSLLIYRTTRNKVLVTHWGMHTERGHTHTHIEV